VLPACRTLRSPARAPPIISACLRALELRLQQAGGQAPGDRPLLLPATSDLQVGPARPLLPYGDDDVSAVAERFSGLLWSFKEAPWTLQRLCELLLEPKKQYKRLHKLVRLQACRGFGGWG